MDTPTGNACLGCAVITIMLFILYRHRYVNSNDNLVGVRCTADDPSAIRCVTTHNTMGHNIDVRALHSVDRVLAHTHASRIYMIIINVHTIKPLLRVYDSGNYNYLGITIIVVVSEKSHTE